MLGIKHVRDNPDQYRSDYKRRKKPELLEALDDVLKKDSQLRLLKQDLDTLRSERNKLSQEVNRLKKAGEDAAKVLEEVKAIPGRIKSKEDEYARLELEIKRLLSFLPSLMHKDVVYGESDKDNVEIKKWGKLPKFDFDVKNHVELLENLGMVDFEASATASGNGFYYLLGDWALLNQALLRYVIDFMIKKGYTYVEPPLLLRKNILFAAVDQESFDQSIYTIEGEDAALIGTSEHAILGMYANKVLTDLPKKYCSYSMCFRKEIGAHGINEKGLWRTHQFNKVEQFVFCAKEDSEKFYDEMLKISEEIFQSLELPYRILELCSGDLARWKFRSCDIEVWRPTTNSYGEITSLSNCTDYQARNLNIRYDGKDGREIVHTLNNTATATSRIMVAIAENYQQKNGTIKVPKVLVPYMNGVSVIEKR